MDNYGECEWFMWGRWWCKLTHSLWARRSFIPIKEFLRPPHICVGFITGSHCPALVQITVTVSLVLRIHHNCLMDGRQSWEVELSRWSYECVSSSRRPLKESPICLKCSSYPNVCVRETDLSPNCASENVLNTTTRWRQTSNSHSGWGTRAVT